MRGLEVKLGTGCKSDESRSEAVREHTSGYATSHPMQVASARPGPSTGHGDPWEKILVALKQRKPNLGSALQNSRVVESADEALVIGIKGSSFQVELADKKESRDMIEQLAAEVMGKRVQITFRLLATETKQESKSAAPKKTSSREHDPFVQDALSIFNGEIVEPESQE
jgi:hypothetical protein